jgi:drug/metabolite transporter (DMT)-like permease
MLVCATNLKYHPIGFVCALISTIIFVVQNIFSKKLFNEARYRTASTRKKLDKLNLLFYSGTFAFIMMFPLWIYYDGFRLSDSIDDINVHLIFLFFLNGVTHFSQAMLAFSVLSLVSPITYSIASLCKRIFVITASILYFGDPVSFPQGMGILLTFVGLHQYHLAEQEVEKGEELVMEIHRQHAKEPLLK